MKPRIQNIARGVFFALITFFGIHSNRASIIDTVFTQDFSNPVFPPPNWVDNSIAKKTGGPGWLYEADGLYGTTGSALCDISNGSTGFLLTPLIDVSSWNANGDSAFLDFDFFWEYNDNNLDLGPSIDDNFQVYLINPIGLMQVLDLHTSTDYTYYNPSYSSLTDPATDQSAWRHYHIAIPSGYRTMDLQVGWQAVPNFGAGNAAIDNVVITGARQNPPIQVDVTPINFIFPPVQVGYQECHVFTITNPGADTVAILSNMLERSDYDFTYTGLIGSDTLLAPGESRLVTVCFDPIRTGTRVTTLKIATIIPPFGSKSDDTGILRIEISGTGTDRVGLVFAIPEIDSAAVGTTNCIMDTLWNTGNSATTITRGGFNDLAKGSFSFADQTFPLTIPADSFALVSICYTPGGRGVDSALATVFGTTIEDSAQNASTVVIGQGGILCAQESKMTLFDSTKTLISTSDTQTVTITNCGDFATSFTANLSGSKDYSIVGSAKTGLIQPGGSATYIIEFTPSQRSQSVAALNVTYSEGISPIVVSLLGTGASVTTVASGEPGNVQQGTCQDFTVTLVNQGNIAWTPNAGLISDANFADYTIVSPPPATIAAGDSGTMVLRFCPTTTDCEVAILTFPNSLPSPQPEFIYILTGMVASAGVTQTSSSNGFILGQNYPNPAHGATTIAFTTPVEGQVQLSLIDRTGAIVQTIATGHYSSGDHIATINVQSLASGTYFCLLTSGNVRLARQIEVVK